MKMKNTPKYVLLRLQSSFMGFKTPSAQIMPTTYATRDEAALAKEQHSREDAAFGEPNTAYVIRFAGTAATAACDGFNRVHDTELRQWRHEVYGEAAPTADALAELEFAKSQPIMAQC
jgi:hypothetical protein